jgi:hypothetical protein
VSRREPWWAGQPKVNRHPALKIPCPQCEVPAGTPCIDSKGRPVHAARFEKWYRAAYPVRKEPE